jgi:hypothetical protein
MNCMRTLSALVLVAWSAGVAQAYAPVPAGFVSVYFGGSVPLPNGQTVVLVASCVSNELKDASYPGSVRFEFYRSELSSGDPNAIFFSANRVVNGPGFAPEAALTISNGSGASNVFHLRILAEKPLVKGLLCHASYTNSLTAPTYRTSLPLERRGKIGLPKDTAS